MSPRAACRLETLHFEHVYDYVSGKADWMASGLAVEGDAVDEPHAIDLARHDVTTCGLDETIADVRRRVDASPYGFAFVTSADGVLLGRLRKASLEGDQTLTAAAAMEPGPSTTRPDIPPAELLGKLHKADLTTAVLTNPEGKLLGLVRRSDLEDS